MISDNGNDAEIHECDLQGFLCCNESENRQECFVYFKFLRQNCGKKTEKRRSGI